MGEKPDEECVEECLCRLADDSAEAYRLHGTRRHGLDLIPDWPSVPPLDSHTCESTEGDEPGTAMTGTSHWGQTPIYPAGTLRVF